MKEKMKKIALGLVIALILSLTVGLYAGAEDVIPVNEAEGITDTAEDTQPDTEPSEDADLNTESDETDNVHKSGEEAPINTNNDANNEDNTLIGGESSSEDGKNPDDSGDYEKNLFDEIYAAIETNADKIFSALAFIGTLVVGFGYKSGLLPLLRDALTKLKGAIDGVKADGEQTRAETDLMLQDISKSLEEVRGELDDIKWQYESYDQIVKERNALRTVIEGQINMLYAVFMTSALPQYQKDEIGEKIRQMREELKSYEQIEEN